MPSHYGHNKPDKTKRSRCFALAVATDGQSLPRNGGNSRLSCQHLRGLAGEILAEVKGGPAVERLHGIE